MAVEELDPVSGHVTTGHEWNGIKELDTAVPRGVLIFLIVTHLFAVIWWCVMPTWPLGTTYTKGWLNTDRPLRLSDELKGHVVVLDFWTYCCINCIHVLPDLEYLEEKYKDDPFIVVGVHSAKFRNESERESIRQAIFRNGVRHPVVIDSKSSIWNACVRRCG